MNEFNLSDLSNDMSFYFDPNEPWCVVGQKSPYLEDGEMVGVMIDCRIDVDYRKRISRREVDNISYSEWEAMKLTNRQAFEMWAQEPPREWSVARQAEQGAWPGQYVIYPVQCAWEAWCAGQGIDDAINEE